MTIDEFYKNYWNMLELRRNSPRMKLLKAYTDNLKKNEVFLTSMERIGKNDSVLDIGAGDKKVQENLLEAGFSGVYKSMDIDSTYTHDFNSLEDITGEYDCVFMLELIEHLELEVSLKYLEKAFKVLKKGGRLFLSTPNIDHINKLWKHDITHIRQYPAKDLYAILRLMNFNGEINIYRIHIRPYRHTLKSKIKEILKIIITKIIEVDYASGIMIIAEK
jgi:SAM-dependent methyltransferase